MARIVVVSSSEIEPALLRDHVEQEDELFIVVPAVEQSRLDWLANDEGEARALAREVGESIATEAPTEEARVDVKPDAPRQALADAIAEHDPDRIIVALRTGEDATWLEEGELAQVPGRIAGIPVTHVAV